MADFCWFNSIQCISHDETGYLVQHTCRFFQSDALLLHWSVTFSLFVRRQQCKCHKLDSFLEKEILMSNNWFVFAERHRNVFHNWSVFVRCNVNLAYLILWISPAAVRRRVLLLSGGPPYWSSPDGDELAEPLHRRRCFRGLKLHFYWYFKC